MNNSQNKKKEKLILFDWGNIVESHTTGYNCYNAWDDLFHKCGSDTTEVIFSKINQYGISCAKTIKEFEKIYNILQKEYNFNTTYEQFIDYYKEIFDKIDYYKDVAAYEASLKDKCYIGIFSDLLVFDKERLNKQVDLSNYDYTFLSFEMGLKKPDKNLYEKIQNNLPFKPKDILFIDDRIENVEMAKQMDWNSFQTTGLQLDDIKRVCDDFLK